MDVENVHAGASIGQPHDEQTDDMVHVLDEAMPPIWMQNALPTILQQCLTQTCNRGDGARAQP